MKQNIMTQGNIHRNISSELSIPGTLSFNLHPGDEILFRESQKSPAKYGVLSRIELQEGRAQIIIAFPNIEETEQIEISQIQEVQRTKVTDYIAFHKKFGFIFRSGISGEYVDGDGQMQRVICENMYQNEEGSLIINCYNSMTYSLIDTNDFIRLGDMELSESERY